MEFIQQNILLIAIAIVSGGMVAFMSFRRPAGSKSLSTTQATLLINREDAQIIDLREPDEYVAGHLPESRNIPAGRLEQRASELDKFKESPLLLICQSGSRSSTASQQLEKLGFTKVHCLEGGINGWRTAGLPLKKGSKK
ncbi:rhodanese-like domain-containing protein [Propionivibrio sp.]|uniref:rhodanese-like domain-containing protein n=1 Tax=Propionivibrio sp. TaxID=2212460 RepID=UPI0025E7FCC1|nr:rhodanese-like domain-containing protein [Propionivibrio sp.]MBK7355360.1 rhodanese-like domain-containing protein [Propionivibrio sp.]MBK8399756.1 rhodanese-like domain-containing protein [Propionivibrio sp.]MBK8743348.1 rhodanese-like domain-containing protein [Propionivibrio sp.]MBK8894628.1 rhodanese-like domain-containing protein [Propionivibrio sp.]MBL0207111.1 rhodanese-like domain-containing protein [Propionivibrio sp.]